MNLIIQILEQKHMGCLQFDGDALNDTTPGHSTKYVLEFNSTLINSISGFTYLGEYNNHNYFYFKLIIYLGKRKSRCHKQWWIFSCNKRKV